MQLLALIAVVGLAAICVVAFAKAVTHINRKAKARYGIRPISWGRCFVMVVPYALVFLGLLMNTRESDHNFIAGVIVAALVMAGVFWWIKLKTDARTAAVSTFLLAFIGLILAGIIFFVLLWFANSGKGKERQRRER